MNIDWIKTFLKAAEKENFRQASEELFITQPAVTKHIQRLEEWLDISLFDRNGKAVKLTPAGLFFLPRAKEMMNSFDQNVAEFNAWKQGYTKKLAIACAPQIASSFLPPLLKQFVDRFPEIDLQINIHKSYEIGEKVGSGAADIGLARMPSYFAGTSANIIHREPIVLAGPVNERADEILLLENYRVLVHNHPVYWEELLKELKKIYPYLKTMTVSQMDVTKRFIEAGLGVSYIPKSMVKEELVSGRLSIYPSAAADKQASITYLIEKTVTEETALFKQFLLSAENDRTD
ncbi:LysR family transcriptional regulator [Domibacillus robiginosus]|uniref:LysR family transcriptional regulator n=1 Tax=Domibacillus robiginosus TaxID=1071054 RepID=UPI00067C42CF|nr:LysR family transcriptional regulator [Domibacillus robiginosus]